MDRIVKDGQWSARKDYSCTPGSRHCKILLLSGNILMVSIHFRYF